jgi:hypothetical protein
MRVLAVVPVPLAILFSWYFGLPALGLAAHAVLPFLVFALWPRRPWPVLVPSVAATIAVQWIYATLWIALHVVRARAHGNEHRIMGEGITLVFLFLLAMTFAYPVFCLTLTGACAGVRWVVVRK